MQKVSRFLLIISIFSICLIFSGCKNSYENMIEEFDAKYFMPEPVKIPGYSINDSNFRESEMLEPSYVFPEGIYVNLEAREGGNSYSWKCINNDGTETEISTSRVLYYETPGAFKYGEENTLLLTVTVSNGNENVVEYTDHAIVFLKQRQVTTERLCTLSIGLNDSMSARTINPSSFTEHSPELTHFVLKGISITTGAELNGGAGIDLSSSLTGNPPVASYDIPYGAWELTLEAGDGTDVLLKGRQFVDLRKSKDNIRFVLQTTNVDKNGSVLLKGTFIDEGNVAKVCEAGLYDLQDKTLKYPFNVTIDDSSAPEYSFIFNELTDVVPNRYSLIMNFYDSSDVDTRNLVGYWEDIVVVAPGRKTEKTDIECKAIISQLPKKPAKLTAYSVDDSVVDKGEEGQFFTTRFVWEDSSNNEECFVLTLYKCEDRNKPDNREFYKVYTVEDGIIDLRAGSQQCDVQLPCEIAFIATIQAKNFLGLSDACEYKKDSGNNSDGTKGFGGSTIWYKP